MDQVPATQEELSTYCYKLYEHKVQGGGEGRRGGEGGEVKGGGEGGGEGGR